MRRDTQSTLVFPHWLGDQYDTYVGKIIKVRKAAYVQLTLGHASNSHRLRPLFEVPNANTNSIPPA